MASAREVLEPLLNEQGELPDDKIQEAIEKLGQRLKLSGKHVNPALQYQLELGHQMRVNQTLLIELTQMKRELLDVNEQLLRMAGADPTPDDYDPAEDRETLWLALELDKMARLYDAVMS